MKKLILLLLTILLCLQLLIGCARKTMDIYSKGTSEETTESSLEETSSSQEPNDEATSETMSNPDRLNGIDVKLVNHNDVKIWPEGTALGFSSNLKNNYGYEMFNADQYVPDEFIDNSAEKTLKITILDSEYTLIYDKSINLPLANYTIHIYNIKELDNGATVYIDTRSGQIVRYWNIPTRLNLTLEKNYTDMIKDIVGKEYDFAQSEYKCYTLYRDANYIGQSISDFKSMNDDELLTRYEFYYTKFVDGIQTNEHVSAIFFPDNTFMLEVWNFDYKKETFSQTLKYMDNFDEYLYKYLNNCLKDGYTITECEFGNHQLFVKDNVVYVSSVVSMMIRKDNSSNEDLYLMEIISTLGEVPTEAALSE